MPKNIDFVSEAEEQLTVEANPISTIQFDQRDQQGSEDGFDDIWHEDENEALDDSLDHAFTLNREWKRRHEQFHTMGYRDGITAGKETSAQEGFNAGFKQSVQAGYNWGLVRGITSVLASIPDDLKEKLVGSSENRQKVQKLSASVHAISSNDALKMFDDSVLLGGSSQSSDKSDGGIHETTMSSVNTARNILEDHHRELLSLLHGLPHIKENLEIGNKILGKYSPS